jgi:hypothetical protein
VLAHAAGLRLGLRYAAAIGGLRLLALLMWVALLLALRGLALRENTWHGDVLTRLYCGGTVTRQSHLEEPLDSLLNMA